MNKKQLIAALAAKDGISQLAAKKQIESVIETLGEVILQERIVSLKGFGTFKVSPTKARVGRNPQTGEPLQIPAGKRISYSVSPALKGKL